MADDYTQYPMGFDVQELLSTTGLTLATNLDFDGVAAAAAADWDTATQWFPYLAAGEPATRWYDPPGAGPEAGRTTSYRGGRILSLETGIVSMAYDGLSIGALKPIDGTPQQGGAGTVLTMNLHYFLRPQNAVAKGLAYTEIEFLTPIRGLPQSIAVTATFGRVTVMPANVWKAIQRYAAAKLAPELGLTISGGVATFKEGDEETKFNPDTLGATMLTWEADFKALAKTKKRISA
jgi:hypothetical protein